MELRLIKLSDQPDAGIYNMLQEIPPFENGFVNPMHGKPFGEFRGWLQSCKADAEQKGLLDGWKVPESTYWLYDGDRPVGYGKIRRLGAAAVSGVHKGFSKAPAPEPAPFSFPARMHLAPRFSIQ